MKINIFSSLDLMLYRIEANKVQPIRDWPEYFMSYKLVIYKPKLLSLGKYDLNPFINSLWQLLTFGKTRVLLLFDKTVKVHYFYFTPKTYRFGYMNKTDINLAQAFTWPAYRRKGILTNVLKLIFAYNSNKCKYIWGYCHIDNSASQKALERAGMEFVSYARMSRFTRIVHMVEEL
ncbi:MAG TPA: N-acetyltransferase [Caldithrix sp.]|nr:N-acetyltransferase [Caldithrix sp.]